MTYTSTTVFVNSGRTAVQYYLEPWGNQYVILPGGRLKAIAKAPDPGTLEVQLNGDDVTVFGWVGSIVDIIVDGPSLPQQ
jgi:hypothetical protein